MKLPSLYQWGQFFNILSRKEKITFFVFFSLAIITAGFLNLNFYFKNTKVVPAPGGTYKEGVIGQPRFINPLYLSTQDTDRDLVELLFSGLMKYNAKGELVKDLAQDFKVEQDGKAYEFQLKKNLFWHDGKPLTSEDIAFTVKLAQTSQYKSPLRIEWLGVKVEILGKDKIRFLLQKKYFSFLETIARLKIIPKHIFQDISPQNLPWALTSQKYLTGSGPFKFNALSQDKSGYLKKLVLERNENYYSKKPYLKEISFLFYQTPEELLQAKDNGEIQGFSLPEPKYLQSIKKQDFKAYFLSLPRYFAIFFNLKNPKILSEKKIREAITLGINKKEILDKVFFAEGQPVSSPILPKYYGLNPPKTIYGFNPDKAKKILDEEGFHLNSKKGVREKNIVKKNSPLITKNLSYGSEGKEVKALQECLARDKKVYPEGVVSGYFGSKTKKAVIRFQEKYKKDILTPFDLTKGTGKVRSQTRKKLNEICNPPETEILPLEISLATVEKFPLIDIAKIIKEDLNKVGIKVKIKQVSVLDFESSILKGRNFESLLFGESLGALLDPFPFWHSSQKEYPGLNLTQYNSRKADKFLEEIREVSDEKERKQKLEEFQNVLVKDLPAIFLVSPDYIYVLNKEIKGYAVKRITEPAKRFSGIENWYLKTRRVWK